VRKFINFFIVKNKDWGVSMRLFYSTVLGITTCALTSIGAIENDSQNNLIAAKINSQETPNAVIKASCPPIVPQETQNAHLGFLYVDYLFWKAQNNDWCWGIKYTDEPTALRDLEGLRGKATWGSGVKAQLGFSKIFDWTISGVYTHFKKTSHAKEMGDQITTLFFPLSHRLGAASKMKVNYNVADLEFAGSSFLSKTMLFKPIIGIRGAWFVNSYHNISYGLIEGTGTVTRPLVPFTAYVDLPQHFWGFGPRAGAQVSFQVGKTGLSFLGSLTGSFLTGKMKLSHRIKTVKEDTIGTVVVVSKRFDRARDLKVSLQAILGAEWRYFFDCHQKDLFVHLQWEGNYWMGQGNYIRLFGSDLLQKAFFLHGINFGIGFDY
jgi:hypothetical protein